MMIFLPGCQTLEHVSVTTLYTVPSFRSGLKPPCPRGTYLSLSHKWKNVKMFKQLSLDIICEKRGSIKPHQWTSNSVYILDSHGPIATIMARNAFISYGVMPSSGQVENLSLVTKVPLLVEKQ